jgi:hypothetical protein
MSKTRFIEAQPQRPQRDHQIDVTASSSEPMQTTRLNAEEIGPQFPYSISAQPEGDACVRRGTGPLAPALVGPPAPR